jgi:uncharacterized protein YbjT (DUF2867 family)
MKIFVTGATGTVGKLLVPKLLEAGHEVGVLTRGPHKLKGLSEKVTVHEGSLLDKDVVAAGCEGADAMFLVTAMDDKTETEQGLTGVAAAKEVGIGRVVYMTVHRVAQAPQVPHFSSKIPVKEALAASGLDHVFIEPSSFFQADLFIEEPLRLFSIYPQPIGSVGVSRVDARDIADAVQSALTGSGESGEAYPLVGPDILDGEDCARIWGQHLSADVQYIGDDLDNWEKQAEIMMPPWLAHDLRIMYEYFQEVGLRASGDDLARCERILGHSPRRFHDFVSEVAATWK